MQNISNDFGAEWLENKPGGREKDGGVFQERAGELQI